MLHTHSPHLTNASKVFSREHAARQLDPSEFKSFRRQHPDGFPDGIDVVFGVSVDGASKIQSLRIDASKFSEGKAKAWLVDHGFKSGRFEPASSKVLFNMEILAKDLDQRLVFGWLYVCRKADGTPVVDHSGEQVAIAELEKATYSFVLKSRQAGQMHEKIGVGQLVESVVFTSEKRAAMGIPDGVIPDGTWVGFKIQDQESWDGVKSGRFKMFSFGGQAIRRTIGSTNVHC